MISFYTVGQQQQARACLDKCPTLNPLSDLGTWFGGQLCQILESTEVQNQNPSLWEWDRCSHRLPRWPMMAPL